MWLPTQNTQGSLDYNTHVLNVLMLLLITVIMLHLFSILTMKRHILLLLCVSGNLLLLLWVVSSCTTVHLPILRCVKVLLNWILIRFSIIIGRMLRTHTHTHTHTVLIAASSSSRQARQGREPAWVGFCSLQRGLSFTHWHILQNVSWIQKDPQRFSV